ncbi:MAG TPA: TonB family protein [Candidatus Omnitrophota bacterium]|nr:TonB family protein [Candidatus Omnitrophota bacterium]
MRFVFCSIFCIACMWPWSVRAAGIDNLDFFLLDDEEKQERARTYTNQFENVDIRIVLQHLSSETGVRIIADPTVEGMVSGNFQNAPVDEVLRFILSAGNYSFRLMPEGYYLVGSCQPGAPSFNRLSVTDFFQPNYLKAEELHSLMPAAYSPYIKINKDVNMVTITASPDMAARIKEDLVKFDRAPRQVMIEALIIEISQEDSKALGINWGPMTEAGLHVNAAIREVSYSGRKGGQPSSRTTISGLLSADAIARINAMVATGKARVKANPRVATLEGRQAEISVGTEEYAAIEAGAPGNRYSTLQSINAGVILKITPFLDEKEQITVRIAPEVSEVTGQGSTGLPIVTKRTALTTLRVDAGQTIAIGGLIQDQKRESTNKWPVLGGIPLIGPALFQHKVSVVESKEVIILITPHILQDTAFDRLQKIAVSLDGDKQKPDAPPPQDPVQRYYYEIGRLVESNKKFPDFIRAPRPGESKEVVVEFTVFADGMITGATVVTGSGNSFLDENAIHSIENLSPLPPFPAELNKTNVTFTASIRYES